MHTKPPAPETTKTAPAAPCAHSPSLWYDAIVVGASISGLWISHLLRQQGLQVLLVDACADVGGSWQYHRYPGCGVDAEVPYYEFSHPNLWSHWNWSDKFPYQDEIQRYLGFVCDKLGLRPHLRLETRVSAVHWDDFKQVWHVFDDTDHLADCRYFVSCAGYATIPHIPDFVGRKSFPVAFHTSQWPKDLEYAGKRVGVIGTGSSGVQCIEAIAAEVASLVVFQKSPNLATPRRQESLTAQQCQKLKEQYPALFAQRHSRSGYAVTHAIKTADHTPAEQQQVWEDLWKKGGSAPWRDNYTDLLTDKPANDAFYRFWRDKTRSRIRQSEVADLLAPQCPPYAFGTRRPALETRYFEVFNQSNVQLVDLHSEAITDIAEGGVQTSKAFYGIDVLVFATGFDFITGAMLAIDVRGRHGQTLADRWNVAAGECGVSTSLGLMTRGFPNMFFSMGPQAPTALAFTPHMAEVQGQWISDFIASLESRRCVTAEPTEEAETWWREELTRASENTLFPRTDSWYMGQNVGDRKRQPLCYFGGVDTYVEALQHNRAQDYPGFVRT